MKLTQGEIEFLSAWAREEWEDACYRLPAHRMQLNHGVKAAELSRMIKAWAACEGTKDIDILNAAFIDEPHWPWSNAAEFTDRIAEANREGFVASTR